jgi:hypothetical protein
MRNGPVVSDRQLTQIVHYVQDVIIDIGIGKRANAPLHAMLDQWRDCKLPFV